MVTHNIMYEGVEVEWDIRWMGRPRRDIMSWMSWPGRPVQDMMSQMGHPILDMMSRLGRRPVWDIECPILLLPLHNYESYIIPIIMRKGQEIGDIFRISPKNADSVILNFSCN